MAQCQETRILHAMRHVALAVIVAVAACKAPIGPGPATIAGTYELQTIKGEALPWTFARHPNGSPSEEFTGGSIVLRTDSTFTWTTNARVTSSSGTVTQMDNTLAGTFSKSGDALDFTIPGISGNFPVAVTLDGNTLTLMYDIASPWVFRRP